MREQKEIGGKVQSGGQSSNCIPFYLFLKRREGGPEGLRSLYV